MEQQKLPNVTLIIVLSIASIVLCWCYGILGLILSIIALILATLSNKAYKESPEIYSGIGTLKTGKILAIVGLILNILFIAFIIWFVMAIGWDVLQSGDQQLMQERMEEFFGQ
tara:strand:- start:7922 stop:8260 length:339 start_codon:yes stop_codon:yes gene_type:complete